VRSINDAVKASEGLYLLPQKLELAFDIWWPDLEQALQAIPVTPAKNQKRRDEREMLEEVLEIVRSLSRSREHVLPLSFWAAREHAAELTLSEAKKRLKDLLKEHSQEE
jgi:hypothetical protein